MRFKLASAVAVLALATACSVDDGVNRPSSARDLELYTGVSEIRLLQDDSRPIGAMVRDRNSGQRESVQIAYASDNANIASVSSAGDLMANAPGTATITMTAEDPYQSRQLTKQIAVAVLPNPVVAVELTPASVTLFVDDTATLVSVVLNETGLDLFRRARQFSVLEGDEAFASVSGFGVVTAKAAGTARIVVEAEGFRDTATVVVSGPAPVAQVAVTPNPVELTVGGSENLTVVLTSSQGRELSGRPVTFETSNASVATVSASGVVTAVGAGAATVTATSEGKSASVSVTVTAAP